MRKPNLFKAYGHDFAVFLSSVSVIAITSTSALANDECGVATSGGTIICNGDGSPSTDISPYSSGISYTSNGLDLTVNGAATTITTTANDTSGVSLIGTGINPITSTVASTTSINLTGHGTGPEGSFNMGGIRVEQQGTGATTINSAADITSAASNAHGIVGRVTNIGNTETLDINVTGGTINVAPGSYGIYALHDGLGAIEIDSAAYIDAAGSGGVGINVRAGNSSNTSDIRVNATGLRSGRIYVQHEGTGKIDVTSGGDIITTGVGHGISAHISGASGGTSSSTKDIQVNATKDGTISTTGSNARGIFGRHSGSGTIDIDSAAAISTAGANAQGIYAYQDYGTANGAIDINTTGSVSTSGSRAHAIEGYVYSATNTDDIRITTSGGPVKASGANAHGIYAHQAIRASDSFITISNEVAGGSGNGVGVNALSRGTATITLDSGAKVTASSGKAIVNDAGASNVVANTGSAVVGSINLGGGLDTLNFAGGDFSGVTLFDGGAGLSDALSFMGSSGTLVGTLVKNWESLAIGSGSLITLNNDTGLSVPVTAIQASGTLRGLGVSSITSVLSNNGSVSTQDGIAGDALTLNGNYSGGGKLLLDTDFSTDTSDVFTINGDVTGGITSVSVNDVSSGSATGNDVQVINVTGTTKIGDFTLGTPVVSGAYTYGDLSLTGSSWYLAASSAALLNTTPTYEIYANALQRTTALSTFRERVGNRNWVIGDADFSRGLWLQIEGEHANVSPEQSTTNARFTQNTTKLRLGFDAPIFETGAGQLIAGINGFLGQSDVSVSSAIGNGTADIETKGLALTLSWLQESGFYADSQLQFSQFDTNLAGVSGNSGKGVSASLEIGQTLDLQNGWAITPQAQYIMSSVEFDDFVGTSAEAVSLNDGRTSQGSIGVLLDRDWTSESGQSNNIYGLFNLRKNIDGRSSVDVSGTELINVDDGVMAELGIGGELSLADDRYSIYGEVRGANSLENATRTVAGNIGFKMAW
jgi:outer membrane autotransporter protein